MFVTHADRYQIISIYPMQRKQAVQLLVWNSMGAGLNISLLKVFAAEPEGPSAGMPRQNKRLPMAYLEPIHAHLTSIQTWNDLKSVQVRFEKAVFTLV